MIFDRSSDKIGHIITTLNHIKLILKNIFKLYTDSIIVVYIECRFKNTSPTLKKYIFEHPEFYNIIRSKGYRWYYTESWQGNLRTKNQIKVCIPIITDIAG